MGIGVVGIQTSQKKEQAGPPFVSNSADNGLSVDGVSGHIVLGNDPADPAAPAALLSNREILTEDALFNLFSIVLNSIQTGIATLLNGQIIQVFSNNSSAPTISASDGLSGNPTIIASVAGGLGGTAQLTALAAANDNAALTVQAGLGGSTLMTHRVAGNIWQLRSSGANDYVVAWSNFGIGIDGMVFYGATIQMQVGPTIQTKNSADFQISGTATYRRTVESNGGPTYNIDRNLDSGKLFRNSAAVNFVLPNMAGANSRPGFVVRVRVFNAAGVTITAVGQAINFGSLVTGTAGTLFSTDVGACITITYDVDGWVTESFVGAWGLT
jgi:hypothetical protein